MALTQGFTGKGVAVELPSGAGVQRAQEGMSQMILDAEKLRYETFQKNKSEFLKNANIDPLFVLSNAARETQMKEIDNFNKVWGKRAQETNYNLSQDDLLKMQTHKNLIISNQQKQMADYERFKQHTAMAAQNPNRYSQEKLEEWQKEYLDSGVYDHTMPPIKPLAPGSAIRTLAQKLEGVNPAEVVKGKMRGIETYPFPSEKEAQDFAQEVLLKNDQYMLGALEEWGMLPQATKDTYLIDENRDKTISESEQQNGIMKWMRERYGKEAMQPQYSNWRTATVGKTVGGTSATSKIPEGSAVAYKKYGNMEYNNSYEFDGSKILRNVSTNGAVGIFGDYEDQLASGNISGRLLLYNPDKDVLVFETVGPSESADTKGTTLVEIPAKNITGINDIPITINGVKGTVGQMRTRNKNGVMPTVTKKPKPY